jgi:hypothetical protein
MRLKLILAAALSALLLTAIAAQAGPINVAVYRFQSQGEVDSFYKVKGAKCAKSWRKQNTLGVRVRKGTNACGFRSSVVADSQDPGPDQEMAAAVNLAIATPAAMRNRIYLGLAVRESKTASYEFRLLPGARRWQVWRLRPPDPAQGRRRQVHSAAGCPEQHPAAGLRLRHHHDRSAGQGERPAGVHDAGQQGGSTEWAPDRGHDRLQGQEIREPRRGRLRQRRNSRPQSLLGRSEPPLRVSCGRARRCRAACRQRP